MAASTLIYPRSDGVLSQGLSNRTGNVDVQETLMKCGRTTGTTGSRVTVILRIGIWNRRKFVGMVLGGTEGLSE